MNRSDVDVKRLRELWVSRAYTIARIAGEIGCSPATVKRLARENGFPTKTNRMYNTKCQNRWPDPTPEEIAERCAEIRRKKGDESWTGRWEVPKYSYDNRTGIFS